MQFTDIFPGAGANFLAALYQLGHNPIVIRLVDLNDEIIRHREAEMHLEDMHAPSKDIRAAKKATKEAIKRLVVAYREFIDEESNARLVFSMMNRRDYKIAPDTHLADMFMLEFTSIITMYLRFAQTGFKSAKVNEHQANALFNIDLRIPTREFHLPFNEMAFDISELKPFILDRLEEYKLNPKVLKCIRGDIDGFIPSKAILMNTSGEGDAKVFRNLVIFDSRNYVKHGKFAFLRRDTLFGSFRIPHGDREINESISIDQIKKHVRDLDDAAGLDTGDLDHRNSAMSVTSLIIRRIILTTMTLMTFTNLDEEYLTPDVKAIRRALGLGKRLNVNKRGKTNTTTNDAKLPFNQARESCVFFFSPNPRPLFEQRKSDGHERSDAPGKGKAPHLRRGHIRMQRCGPGLSELRKVLIPPTFVNGDQYGGSMADVNTHYED
jgi:hypothetical protein